MPFSSGVVEIASWVQNLSENERENIRNHIIFSENIPTPNRKLLELLADDTIRAIVLSKNELTQSQ